MGKSTKTSSADKSSETPGPSSSGPIAWEQHAILGFLRSNRVLYCIEDSPSRLTGNTLRPCAEPHDPYNRHFLGECFSDLALERTS